MKRLLMVLVVAALMAVMMAVTASSALAAKSFGSNCGDGTPFITNDSNDQNPVPHTSAFHGCGAESPSGIGKGNCGSKDGALFVTPSKAGEVLHACGEFF